MPRRMGRPGLMGTMARTAVIAGTATAVSGSVHQKQAASAQANQAASAAPAPAPAPAAAPTAAPPSSTDELVAKIKSLGELKDAGLLTEEEFAAEKTKLLNA